MKITVAGRYSPEEVFGHEIVQSSSGKAIPTCQFFEDGQELILENSFKMPDDFCGWAWRDLTVRLTKFDLIDVNSPGPNVTCVACGDGVRPVIFRLEKLHDCFFLRNTPQKPIGKEVVAGSFSPKDVSCSAGRYPLGL